MKRVRNLFSLCYLDIINDVFFIPAMNFFVRLLGVTYRLEMWFLYICTLFSHGKKNPAACHLCERSHNFQVYNENNTANLVVFGESPNSRITSEFFTNVPNAHST